MTSNLCVKTLYTIWHFGQEQQDADYFYEDGKKILHLLYNDIHGQLRRLQEPILTFRTGLNNALHQFIGRIAFQCSCYNSFVSLTT